ncbi:MAG: DUF5717 family protein [Bacteroides sp.]|nr:DUF5717 family protein [Bacteroides sp.]MCM1548982.1 DUF5717 family protein [Clostridium sp.]
MKEKVEQYAKGEYNVNRPKVAISTDHLQLNIEAGSVYQGFLEVDAQNDRKMKGMVYDNRYLFKIEPHNFIGKHQQIELTFDARKWEKGEKISGSIYLITDGGEFGIPYTIEITAPTVETSIGELGDMFQFASLAESNWNEAVRIFASPEFKRTFLEREPMYGRVYESLTRSLSASQAMEEFLTYTHKKRTLSLDVAERKQYLPYHEKTEKHSIPVTRNTWGYLNAEISSDVRFLQPVKRYLSTEDFIGNKFQLEYMVLPEYVEENSNVGHITIENIYQKIVIDIIVKATPENRIEPPQLFTNRHMIKVHQHSLIASYLDFRTGKLDLNSYVDKSLYALRNLIQYCREDYLYRLGILHMNILAGNESMAEEEFKRIDADKDKMVSGVRESCYYVYLKALAYKDAASIEKAKRQIREVFEAEDEKLFYFWLLIFLDDSEGEDRSSIYLEIQKLYAQGIHSPILYHEVCDLFNHEPLMLRKLTGLEILAIRWGMQHDYVSEDVIGMCVELAGREHGFQPALFRLLQEIDKRYPSEEVLRTICGMLIRANKADRSYHEYFVRGIERGFKLIGIYECYIRSIDMKAYPKLPEAVIRYLAYSNTLTDYEMAYVYANLIKNKGIYPGVYGELSAAIESYMESQIQKGVIHEFLLVIYKEFLNPEHINPKYAARLTNIIFKRRLTCSNPNMKSVIVNHKELLEEQQVPILDGVAYVDIITDSAVITLVDTKGNRYTSTVPYRLERLVDAKIYVTICHRYNLSDARLLAYIYSRMDHKNLQDAADVNQARDVLECAEISYAVRQQALLQIIEYYLENYDGDILERYLLQVDLEYLDKLHSAEIISGYIMRGMNRKAYEAIKRFGYGDVDISRLLRLASYIVTDTDILGDEALTALCIYLYQKGQYNDRIMQYLVFQYKADTRELSRLWDAAMVVLGEAGELEENILAQMIFSDSTTDNAIDIFRSYYKGRHRGMVIKAFLRKMAYMYFIREERVPDAVFEYIMLEMEKGEIQDDISHGAVLWHLSRSARLNEEQTAYVSRTIKRFMDRGIVLPFFKAFFEIMDLPEELFLKTYLVYKGEERRDVIVNYSVGTSELQTLDFRPCRMEERIPGYYVQEFIVFHGEQLLYHFSEEYTGPVTLVESDSIRNDAYRKEEPESRFERLNQMLISQEMRDSVVLTESMEEYMKNSHVFEEILRIL